MGRKHRSDYDYALRHVFNRASARRMIFRNEDHCHTFLKILEHVINYLSEDGRGDDEPLCKTRGGHRLHRIDVANICKHLSLITPDRIKLTPHMLRHTFLKRVTVKHGVHIAQKLSGNVSIREIFRYAKPSEEESLSLVEKLYYR